MTTLHFEAEYDLPPEIVWDALVDSDLVSGWLAEADIEPRVGGRFDLEWRQLEPARHTTGEITGIDDLRELVVELDNYGVVSFVLEGVAGGTRGFGARLRVRVDALADQHFSGTIVATWRLALEHLDGLLAGHPVNWASWQNNYGARWAAIATAEIHRN